MRIFTPAYVILALASWSALAAPLHYTSERNNENVERNSLASSILTGRQNNVSPGPGLETIHISSSQPIYYEGTGIEKPQTDSSTKDSDCGDSKSKSKSKSNDGDKTNDSKHQTANIGSNSTPATMTTSGLPVIARRSFRSPMTRRSEVSPSIWGDSGASSTKDKRVTVGDVFEYYLRRRAAFRKRAVSSRTGRSAR